MQLSRLASAFGWSDDRAANEVLAFIERSNGGGGSHNDGDADGDANSHDALHVKLDLVDNTVYADKRDEREELFANTLRAGQRRVKNANRILFRMQVVKNGLTYKQDAHPDDDGGARGWSASKGSSRVGGGDRTRSTGAAAATEGAAGSEVEMHADDGGEDDEDGDENDDGDVPGDEDATATATAGVGAPMQS